MLTRIVSLDREKNRGTVVLSKAIEGSMRSDVAAYAVEAEN